MSASATCSTRNRISEICDEVLFLKEEMYDEAIIGLVELPSTGVEVVAYSRNKVIEVLEADGMSHDEANEYFDFNILRALPYMGEFAPVFVDERFAE